MPRWASWTRGFRARRMRRFAETFAVRPETRVLDVGGDAPLWMLLSARPRVTILNMPRAAPDREGFDLVFADGCALPFADQSFDIVFSNSVIEHVGNSDAQRQFANEIRRVGRSYFVQTPNRWFPIEPHLLTPLIHWLPRSWQGPIVRRFTVWQWVEKPSEDRRRFYLEHYLRDIRLLSGTQMAVLFPEATLLRERWLGLTKSLIAVKK
jgi:SAM-dependent methyltransferase